MDDFFQTIHEAKSLPLKILVFFFYSFSLKILCLDPKSYFIHISILEFERARKSSKKKSDWLERFFEQKRQIWCQYIALNEKNIFKVFLSFYITEEIRSRLSFLFKFVFLN